MVGTILRLTIYLFFTLDTEILFTDENLIYKKIPIVKWKICYDSFN